MLVVFKMILDQMLVIVLTPLRVNDKDTKTTSVTSVKQFDYVQLSVV